jgi:predicted PurR-regulated permease PerM
MKLKNSPPVKLQPDSTPSKSIAKAIQNSTAVIAANRRKDARQNRYVIIVVFVGLLVLLLPMVQIFALPLVLATTIVLLCYPMYQWLTKVLWKRKALGSLASCLVIIICAILPASVLGSIITRQAITFYTTAQPELRKVIQNVENGRYSSDRHFTFLKRFNLSSLDLQSSFQDLTKSVAKVATTVVNKTSAGILGLFANLMITLFAMFYLFIDGEAFVQKLKHLIPLRSEYKVLMFFRFTQISRATIKVTLIIGIIQGALGALTLLVFGIKTWILWGVAIMFLSLLPVVGAWTVLVPAAIVQFFLGNPWHAAGILLMTIVVISNVDNIIKPRLIGHEAKLHDLVVFLSTIGGLYAFGVMGFLVGPVVASLFVTIIEIYNTEFSEFLDVDEGHG